MIKISDSVKQRFNEKYIPVPESGCWIWEAHIGKDGYGQIYNGKRDNGSKIAEKAHRLSWVIENGQIDDGLHVLHKCDVRACVNPDHLFLGTNEENIQDSVSKGRRKGVSRNRPKFPSGYKKKVSK